MPVLTATPTAPTAPAPSWARIFLPSLLDFFFLALLLWLFAGAGAKGLLGDGDTGWHIRTGDYILEHHAVPRQDIFTFTKPNEPWYAWEWLSDVIFASLHRAGGLKAVALLAGVLLCGTALVLFCHMMWNGGNLFFALAAALLANGSSTVHYLARPHVFTFFLVAVSMWLLARDRRSPDRRVWLLVPIAALWVNLHGGFLALLACLGLTVAGYGLQWLAGRGSGDLFYLKRYSILTVLCSLATLANPYGYRLHVHILGYFQSSFVKNTVQEFQSPAFRDENMLQFEILLFAGLALAGLLLAKKKFVEALLILFWAQESLSSVRHVPIYAIVAAPILIAELTLYWNRWTRGMRRGSLGGIIRDLGTESAAASLRTTVWIPIMVFGLGLSMASANTEYWPDDFPKARFPVALVHQYAGLLAPESGPMPRILTTDQWGDYLTYCFYPRIRVFIDGRSDLFGPELGNEYVHLASAHYDWEQLLDRYRIDMAIVPVEWPLGELLKRDPRWRLVKDDGLGIFLERRASVLKKSEASAESSTSRSRDIQPMSNTKGETR